MFECRLNQFLVEILQEYNAALGLNNPPPTAQLLNAIATFVKQNTFKNINLSFDGVSKELTAKATYNDNRFAETKVDLSSLGGEIDVFDLAEKLEGSESIVVDINETNDKIEIHLDGEILSKIDRALLLPITTPTQFELVGISNQGEQVRVKLGSGVAYDASTNTIRATSSGGSKLYKHRFIMGDDPSEQYALDIIATTAERIDGDDFDMEYVVNVKYFDYSYPDNPTSMVVRYYIEYGEEWVITYKTASGTEETLSRGEEYSYTVMAM